MLLNSFVFFVFFACVFVLFWKIPKKYQWVLLLLASYYFYGSWKPGYIVLIFLTTIINYYAALAIHAKPHIKGRLLLLTLIFNLGTLFVFKYLNFFELTLNHFWNLSLPQFKLLLPIGISFYTLQVTGYLIDVYKEKIKPETHFGIFALFVSFFPQLSAGPIERGHTLLPQLKKQHAFDYDQVAKGTKLFAIGLFKKLVIADNLGLVVDRVFGSLPEYKGISLIIVIIFYTWQIYMDFSGYTDMARGVAKMMGINLLENFNLPYLATSVRDFWRRWHISFSTWLRDYIYFPLGGSRKGLARTSINTLIVFTVSGLWHGAAWNFVIWGILHGMAISIERITNHVTQNRFAVPRFVKIAYTYGMVSVFWVFFRSPTASDAWYVLRNSVVGVRNFISPSYVWASIEHLFVFNTVEIGIVFGLLFLAVSGHVLQQKTTFLAVLSRQPAVIRLAIYILMLCMIIQLRSAYVQEFIYIRF